MEAEATPLASSVTMIGWTLRAASCSHSGIEASFKLINAAWIFLQRAQIRALAGLTTWREAPVDRRRSRSLQAPGKSTMRMVRAGKV